MPKRFPNPDSFALLDPIVFAGSTRVIAIPGRSKRPIRRPKLKQSPSDDRILAATQTAKIL